jgi:hypothetical protein
MKGPGEAIISAVSVGAVFILIGVVFVLALPNNLFTSAFNFFTHLTTRPIAIGSNIFFFVPSIPNAHAVFYTAVFQFSLGIAFLEILILALRIGFGSHFHKTAETIGNLVSWAGTSFLAYTYLNATTTTRDWFTFWAGILIVWGLSLIVRGIALLVRRQVRT